MKNQLTPLRFIERAAAVHPNRTAILDGTRTLTYAAMAAQVTRLAQALRVKGLGAGDRVAYLAANSAEVLIAHFAVPLAGGVLVTINTRLSAEEIGYIVDHSGARFLVADADLFGATLYIKDKPECPGGGTYSLGIVSAKVACTLSTSGHSL